MITSGRRHDIHVHFYSFFVLLASINVSGPFSFHRATIVYSKNLWSSTVIQYVHSIFCDSTGTILFIDILAIDSASATSLLSSMNPSMQN